MEGWDGWKRLRQVYSSTDNLKATPWLLPACLRVEQEDTNSTWDEQGCSCFSLSSHLSSCTRNTQGPPHALETIVAPTSTPLSLPVTICLPFPPTTTCKVHTPVQIPYKAEEPAGRLRYESHSYGNSTVYFGISKKKKIKVLSNSHSPFCSVPPCPPFSTHQHQMLLHAGTLTPTFVISKPSV